MTLRDLLDAADELVAGAGRELALSSTGWTRLWYGSASRVPRHYRFGRLTHVQHFPTFGNRTGLALGH